TPLLERSSGDQGWFASGEQPAGHGGDGGKADQDENEIARGHPVERAQVGSMPCEQGGVSTGASEDRAEERERAGRRGRRVDARGRAGAGCGQGPQVVGRLTPDQAYGHTEYPEGEKNARDCGPVPEGGERVSLGPGLHMETDARRGCPRGLDLIRRK